MQPIFHLAVPACELRGPAARVDAAPGLGGRWLSPLGCDATPGGGSRPHNVPSGRSAARRP